MKNNIFALMLAALVMVMGACEPNELKLPDVGDAPSASDLIISVTPGADAFHFTFENGSSVSGMASWDLGNGNTGTGDKVSAYYPLPGTYTVKMTLYTKGGHAVTTYELITTDTDWGYFSDPVLLMLCGGADAINGKTWVLDSLTTGHMGVGPDLFNSTVWWSAAPLAKSFKGLYDDEITFKLAEFAAIYDNKGVSYVKDFRTGDPNYSNPRQNDTDYMVDYPGPINGSWGVSDKDGNKVLKLNSDKPIYPCFDTGANDGEYVILNISENSLELACMGGDNNAWHYLLIPKGYVLPAISYTATAEATGNANEYRFAIEDLSVPAGMAITSVEWNLGDGTVIETANALEAQVHTYMRKGNYKVSVAVLGSDDKTYSQDLVLTIENNHPDYEAYLLDAMVMYTDFGETMLVEAGLDAAGGTAFLEVVGNPDNTRYPNRSKTVAHLTKVNNEWANLFVQLPDGYRFDLRKQSTFKVLVYGTAGQEVLLKLENTDKGGNAWQTGCELRDTIQASNTWEIMEFNFSGAWAGWDWTGDIFTADIVADDRFNHDFYNVVRIMYQPGNAGATYDVYLDDIAGPHVEGLIY